MVFSIILLMIYVVLAYLIIRLAKLESVDDDGRMDYEEHLRRIKELKMITVFLIVFAIVFMSLFMNPIVRFVESVCA